VRAPRVAVIAGSRSPIFQSKKDFTFERKEIASKNFGKKSCMWNSVIVIYITI
jgi:hypothetical protein